MATFYKDADGNFLASVSGSPAPAGFEALEPNTVDAATEKHVPSVELQRDGHIIHVQVGEVAHPMTEEHSIEWIALEADDRLELHSSSPARPGDVLRRRRENRDRLRLLQPARALEGLVLGSGAIRGAQCRVRAVRFERAVPFSAGRQRGAGRV